MQCFESPITIVAGEDNIPSGRRIAINSSGRAVVAGVGVLGVGVSSTGRVGLAGTGLAVNPFSPSSVLFIEATAAVARNALVYAAASGRITSTAGTTGGKLVGIALEASDGKLMTPVLPIVDATSDLLYNAPSSSTAVANTTTATVHDRSYTLPIGGLRAGDLLDIDYAGITGVTGTPTLAVRVLIGATAIQTVAATTATAAGIFSGTLRMALRDNSGTLQIFGKSQNAIGAQAGATREYVLAPATLDLSAARVIGVETTWSAADPANTCQLHMLSIRRRVAV